MNIRLGGAAAIGATVLALAAAAPTGAWAARDYVWAAGSSTVFPFSTRVAENYAKKTGKKAPKIESLGTGGGIKLFCSGTGDGFPDIANASRPMKKSEFDACAAKGVKDIVAIKIGFDGIVVANARTGPAYDFKLEHLWLGLGANVLRHGRFVKNPYANWRQVGRTLPAERILVYGPPPTSGTRDAFIELGIEDGAARFPTAAALRKADERKFRGLVDPLRGDGWIDAGENDNAVVQTLGRTPNSLGVFGYSFLRENTDKVKAARIDGVAPSLRTIADGSYPLARSLYIYVKASRLAVTPGLRQFVAEATSDAASGRGGYLLSRGLIPLPAAEHAAEKAAARAATPMSRPAS